MNLKRLLVSGIAAGVVVNVYDYLVHGVLLKEAMAGPPFRAESNIPWLVAGDFVAAFVLAWVWIRVKGAFGSGWLAGLKGGFCAGLLVNLPGPIFLHLLIDNFSYHMAWVWIGIGMAWYLLAGAVIGAVDRE